MDIGDQEELKDILPSDLPHDDELLGMLMDGDDLSKHTEGKKFFILLQTSVVNNSLLISISRVWFTITNQTPTCVLKQCVLILKLFIKLY